MDGEAYTPQPSDRAAQKQTDPVPRSLDTEGPFNNVDNNLKIQALKSHRVTTQKQSGSDRGQAYRGGPATPIVSSPGGIAFSHGMPNHEIGNLSQSASARRLLGQGEASSSAKETNASART